MKIWSYLFGLYRPRLGWLLLAWLSLTLTWLSAVGLLAVSGWFITASAMAGLGLITQLNIFTPSAVIRALAIFRTVGRYGERVIGHEAILRVLADLRVRSFRALANRPARQLDATRHSDLVNRLTADVDTLDGVPLRVIGPLIAAVLTWVCVIVIAQLWGGWPIALIITAGGALTFAASLWAANQGQIRGQDVIQARSAQRVAMTDHFGGLADLLAYGQSQASAKHLARLDYAQTTRMRHQEHWASLAEHAVQALTALMTIAVLALAWPNLTPPEVALLALMTLGMNEALGTLPGAFWRIGESNQAAQHLMDLEADQSTQANAPTAPIAVMHPDPIVIDALVCQRQPFGHQPLTMTLTAGQPVVVHGPSGCGKSSLLATLAGELPAASGQLMLGGIDALALADDQRYEHITLLSQNDVLLDVSIGEFLRLGQPQASDQALRDALEAVDLLQTLEQTPQGLDYRLGVSGSRISGGQARRLQLAALLLRNPALVLLDEPFRGLQPDLVQTILTRAAPWLAARAAIIVTHDPAALPPNWPRLRWPH